ncbi:MAG: PIN domain-containing protein [Myxococcota bacterium]
MIYLDTHVVVMLHEAWTEQIPAKVRKLIETSERILISPMVQLELEYLFELKKMDLNPTELLNHLADDIALEVCSLPFKIVAAKAAKQHWTRDPFDRIITAQAAVDGLPLLTKDRLILDNYEHAVWNL